MIMQSRSERIAAARRWLAEVSDYSQLPEVAALAAAVERGEDPGQFAWGLSPDWAFGLAGEARRAALAAGWRPETIGVSPAFGGAWGRGADPRCGGV